MPRILAPLVTGVEFQSQIMVIGCLPIVISSNLYNLLLKNYVFELCFRKLLRVLGTAKIKPVCFKGNQLEMLEALMLKLKLKTFKATGCHLYNPLGKTLMQGKVMGRRERR